MVTVALVGMMGCGKSAVGRRVAELLGLDFVDTDAVIEAEAGRAIADLFAVEGEASFRARERRLVEGLHEVRRTVLALGGGMFVGDNVEPIRRAAFTVWLRARPETLLGRIGDDRARPLLGGPDPLGRLRELSAARDPDYRRADATIDVDALDVDAAARAVVAALREAGRCG